jgi:hypothetical protein
MHELDYSEPDAQVFFSRNVMGPRAQGVRAAAVADGPLRFCRGAAKWSVWLREEIAAVTWVGRTVGPGAALAHEQKVTMTCMVLASMCVWPVPLAEH